MDGSEKQLRNTVASLRQRLTQASEQQRAVNNAGKLALDDLRSRQTLNEATVAELIVSLASVISRVVAAEASIVNLTTKGQALTARVSAAESNIASHTHA